jgi:hypothetical protein
MDEKNPDKNAFIKRYSPLNVDFQMAWKNLKMFFGNDGSPRTWFYPEMDSKEVKEMLKNYEEQSKFFIVRHWFGINKQNQVQYVEDDGKMGSWRPSSNTVEEYLQKNFASAGLSKTVVSNFASQSRNYDGI